MAERLQHHVASCECGKVRFEAIGEPFLASACYCSDCRTAAAQIAALPGAAPLAEPDSGTECLLYRKDRIACTTGANLLTPMRLKPNSATKRVVTSCCSSAMAMAFDDSRHWISAYRRRFDRAPPIEMRICTGAARGDRIASTNVPSFKGYPVRMMLRLIAARLAMTFHKGETIGG